jgi:hypothetical protein
VWIDGIKRSDAIHYFKRFWDEPRADEYEDWGCSWWYFEVGKAGNVIRQIERYDNGVSLRYCAEHSDDEFGGLAKRPLDLSEFFDFESSQETFDSTWISGPFLNF